MAYTVVLHAALWLPKALLGAWSMLREGLSLPKVRAEVDIASTIPLA